MKEIKLTKGYMTLVDDEDYTVLSLWSWQVELSGGWKPYAKDRTGQKMARVIMGISKGDRRRVDHINGDSLDNRRKNLRVCSIRENVWNTPKKRGISKYKGVTWIPHLKKWRARITLPTGKRIHLGVFSSEDEAFKAYLKKALRVHGEFINVLPC